MKINNLTIENFRGISKAEFKKFSNINVFLGKNNCGKTSVLEALFLLLGRGQARLGFAINRLRQIEKFENLDLLFYKQNLEKSPIIKSGLKKIKLKLLKKQTDILTSVSEVSKISNTLDDFDTLKISFYEKNTLKCENKLKQHPDGFKIEGDYMELPYEAKIMTGAYSIIEPLNIKGIEFIRDYGKAKELTQILQKVDSDIEDWEIGANNQIKIKIKGSKKLRLLNAMGDGTKKIFSIVSNAYAIKNDILLIDEIENGLHHESIRITIESLLAFIETYPSTQFFITTHSLDFLKSLAYFIERDDNNSKKIKVYPIRKYKNEFKIWEYNKEDILNAIKHETEIR